MTLTGDLSTQEGRSRLADELEETAQEVEGKDQVVISAALWRITIVVLRGGLVLK